LRVIAVLDSGRRKNKTKSGSKRGKMNAQIAAQRQQVPVTMQRRRRKKKRAKNRTLGILSYQSEGWRERLSFARTRVAYGGFGGKENGEWVVKWRIIRFVLTI